MVQDWGELGALVLAQLKDQRIMIRDQGAMIHEFSNVLTSFKDVMSSNAKVCASHLGQQAVHAEEIEELQGDVRILRDASIAKTAANGAEKEIKAKAQGWITLGAKTGLWTLLGSGSLGAAVWLVRQVWTWVE